MQPCFNIFCCQVWFWYGTVAPYSSLMYVALNSTCTDTSTITVRKFDAVTCSELKRLSSIVRSNFLLHLGFSLNFRPLRCFWDTCSLLLLRIMFETVLRGIDTSLEIDRCAMPAFCSLKTGNRSVLLTFLDLFGRSMSSSAYGCVNVSPGILLINTAIAQLHFVQFWMDTTFWAKLFYYFVTPVYQR